jgi:hypothetical protein
MFASYVVRKTIPQSLDHTSAGQAMFCTHVSEAVSSRKLNDIEDDSSGGITLQLKKKKKKKMQDGSPHLPNLRLMASSPVQWAGTLSGTTFSMLSLCDIVWKVLFRTCVVQL